MKKSFLSFYYKPDSWRVQQVKQMGAIEGQPILSSNDWESVKGKGDAAVESWIEDNLKGRDCLIALIGRETAGRRWVKYEIKRAAEKGMGVFGVYIHGLKDKDSQQTTKGSDPFLGVTVNGVALSTYAQMYDPPYMTSTYVHDHISDNIAGWIDRAVAARKG